MTLQEWERDVINRQRNIVFPDTILNEGRFYRNIASGKAIFTIGQKVSLLMILGYWVLFSALCFAGAVLELNQRHHRFVVAHFSSCFYMLANLFFWAYVALKGFLFRMPAERKRRRGYRSSSRT
jgi:hypothetical protein